MSCLPLKNQLPATIRNCLRKLTGRDLTDAEKAFFDAAAAIRLKNFTLAANPSYVLYDNERVNNYLNQGLSDIEEIVFGNYLQIWNGAFADAGLEANETRKAIINWVLGRKLTSAENEKFDEMMNIVNSFMQNNPGAEPFDATWDEILDLYSGTPTEEQGAAIDMYFNIKSELFAKLYMLMSGAENEIDYDVGQLNAILTMSRAVFTNNHKLETALPYDWQTFEEEIAPLTLTQEQIDAYEVFKTTHNMYFFKMLETHIGEYLERELTETEKSYLNNTLYIMTKAQFESAADILDTQIYQFEEQFNVHLHQAETEGFYFFKTLVFIKEYVPEGISDEEEINYLTVALMLENEYLSYQSGPAFDENLTDEQFQTVTGRELSAEERAALDFYFGLIA